MRAKRCSPPAGGGAGWADEDADGEGLVGDEGEGMAGIDGEGGEDGEDLGAEIVVGFGALFGGEFDVVAEEDIFAFEGGAEVVGPEMDDLAGEGVDAFADGFELLVGGEAVVGAFGGFFGDFALEEADAFHEEFVGVAGVDGEEFDAFEERRTGVHGFVEDAVVEVEPGEVAVEEGGGVGGKGGTGAEDGRGGGGVVAGGWGGHRGDCSGVRVCAGGVVSPVVGVRQSGEERLGRDSQRFNGVLTKGTADGRGVNADKFPF